ncbi:hypothetical protein, conserved [Trypanosoma brucei gambiense DAL972]|uniref:Cyclic nucleotide-binding domain-containing protein n=1 Tax=Trypanosoma brucei gambiense (strain MHOM/CI/86/DAL972) TaxID=679716 RepID=D0A616_TRYB9|nr:hypothetical protein, conserved [Trypanosoma brucei gambiense DAL972]CBH17117.1 hypothetical protein, conserved [Trypanosoma brucei gambiense DAL972]|eukprot:XP_011779381.1 hypothetical protein, conserved [Trypanosoma brucei gambiense DAL972]
MSDSMGEGQDLVPMTLPVPEVMHVSELDVTGPLQPGDDCAQKSLSGNLPDKCMSVSFAKSLSGVDLSILTRSAGNASHTSIRSGSRARGGNTESYELAAVMVRSYPLMTVEGTAFLNTTRPPSSLGGTEPSVSLRQDAGSPSGVATDDEPLGESCVNLAESGEHSRTSANVMAIATSLKRACMWQVIITNFLAHRAWMEAFCRNKLRSVLEVHLLPVILRRRGRMNLSGRFTRRVCVQKPELVSRDSTDLLQGTYLYDTVPILKTLRNVKFCEALTETVLKYRYSCGQAIASSGNPEQNALYILVSGKCDAITPASETGGKVRRRRLQPGETFGGLFGGKAIFTDVYRAISTCVVYVITREKFEELFSQYADSSMKETFLGALRDHEMVRLKRLHPLPQCIARVPIYRKSEQLAGQVNEYIKGFTPLVLLQGDVLFEQGDPPGDVFCLIEGYVLREQLGPDMKYESGTRQVLAPNEPNNNFALSTRFLLLGEEPHILPGPLRYRCTVASRAALFFKINSDSFVNMLLDDASLLIRLRQKYKEQLQQWMRIAPEALRQVPMLGEMPRQNLNTIIHAAEPRVLERYVAVCEPARVIREIYVLTKGDVRDPRQFDHVPTQPPSLPPTESESVEEEAAGKQRKEKVTKRVPSPRERNSKAQKTAQQPVSPLKEGRPRKGNRSVASLVCKYTDDNAVQWSFEENTELLKATIYPDERQEITPPLPLNPERNIICTIGGGWEGLLLEKWPTGWETTTTVELWAIPTLAIRTEFNTFPKAAQNSILRCIGEVQMRELDLPTQPKVKLPPMSIYTPIEKRLTKPGLNVDRAPLRSPRNVGGSGASHDRSTAGTTSKIGRQQADAANSQSSFTTRSSSFFSVDISTVKPPPSALTSNRDPKTMSPKPAAVDTKVPTAPKTRKQLAQVTAAESAPVEPRKSKAVPASLLLFQRFSKKVTEEPPKITPELRAMYAGEKPQKGIVRESPLIEADKRRSHSCLPTLPITASAWPVLVGRRKRWFPMVPTFAPLPGTLDNANNKVDPPHLVPNTSHMVMREKGYRDVLQSQVVYFTSLANSKACEDPTYLSVSPCTTARSRSSRHGGSTAAHIGAVLPTPGRHAYSS